MSNNPSAIVSKVWNYAHVLKNAGGGYGLSACGDAQAGDYVEVRAAQAFITYLRLAPTFGLRADAQPCGLPVSPSARLLKLADEMTELGGKVAAASRRSLSRKNQKRDTSAILPFPATPAGRPTWPQIPHFARAGAYFPQKRLDSGP